MSVAVSTARGMSKPHEVAAEKSSQRTRFSDTGAPGTKASPVPYPETARPPMNGQNHRFMSSP